MSEAVLKVHRYITELATQGEGVLVRDDEGSRAYHFKRPVILSQTYPRFSSNVGKFYFKSQNLLIIMTKIYFFIITTLT